MYDFEYITKFTGPSLLTVKQEAECRRTFSCSWLVTEIKNVFIQVSDYVLLTDPLQELCQRGLELAEEFERQYAEKFRKKKAAVEEEGRRKVCQSLASQLEMVFYMRAYEDDEELMRKIGEVCQILADSPSEYVFDLGSSSLWDALIGKHHNDGL